MPPNVNMGGALQNKISSTALHKFMLRFIKIHLTFKRCTRNKKYQLHLSSTNLIGQIQALAPILIGIRLELCTQKYQS